jgi:hypothetical protein
VFRFTEQKLLEDHSVEVNRSESGKKAEGQGRWKGLISPWTPALGVSANSQVQEPNIEYVCPASFLLARMKSFLRKVSGAVGNKGSNASSPQIPSLSRPTVSAANSLLSLPVPTPTDYFTISLPRQILANH